jgi:hypothetical protein
MAVRSARLSGPQVVTAGATVTLVTCGAGQTLLVKRITVHNASAFQAVVNFGINGATSGARVHTSTPPAGRTEDEETWLVLEPTDSLRVLGDAAVSTTISTHGAILSGVA